MPFRKQRVIRSAAPAAVASEVEFITDPFDGTVVENKVDPYEKLPEAVDLKTLLKAKVNLTEVPTVVSGAVSRDDVFDDVALRPESEIDDSKKDGK